MELVKFSFLSSSSVHITLFISFQKIIVKKTIEGEIRCFVKTILTILAVAVAATDR